MSRYIVLLGLLAVMGAVYGEEKEMQCGDNQHYNICGNLCQPSCDNPIINPIWCPALKGGEKIVCTKLTSGCRCNKGYVRDFDNGSCVLLKNCPKKQDQQ